MEEKTSIEREISDVEARIRAEGNALKRWETGMTMRSPALPMGRILQLYIKSIIHREIGIIIY